MLLIASDDMQVNTSHGKKTMKQIRRILVLTLFLLPWLVLGLICLELVARWQDGRGLAAAQAYGGDIWAAVAEDDASVIARHGITVPVSGADREARAFFLQSDDEQRQAWVDERGEVAALLDARGAIQRIYRGDSIKPLNALADQMQAEPLLPALLPREEAEDAKRALADALSGGTCGQREYPISQPDGTRYVLQFTFCPTEDEAYGMVFVRDSIWDVLWERFKGNIRQNDIYDVRINSVGFRDREIITPKPEGLFRIACLGGSTTFEGPSNELTYPKMLERMLRERFGEDRIEVINCGVIASTTRNEVARMPEIAALQPDLVIHYNFVNDITFLAPLWIQEFHNAGMAGRVRRFLSGSYLMQRHGHRFLLPADNALREHIDSHVLENVRHIRRIANEHGIAFAAAGFACPNPNRLSAIERDYFNFHLRNMSWGRMIDVHAYARITNIYNQLLRQWAAEENILYIPVDEMIDGGTTQFRDICHMHLKAMERKAEVMAQTLIPYLENLVRESASSGL